MTAKALIAAFLIIFVATMPALGQGNGNGNGNGNGAGNAAQAEDDDTDGSGDGAGTNSAAGNGNNGNGSGNGKGANKSSASDGVTVVPEADLLAIVKAGQAVSLASLVPNVQERTGGEIIDAQLVRTDRALIYAVKVLTPDGHVVIEYYNARSGTYIEAR